MCKYFEKTHLFVYVIDLHNQLLDFCLFLDFIGFKQILWRVYYVPTYWPKLPVEQKLEFGRKISLKKNYKVNSKEYLFACFH